MRCVSAWVRLARRPLPHESHATAPAGESVGHPGLQAARVRAAHHDQGHMRRSIVVPMKRLDIVQRGGGDGLKHPLTRHRGVEVRVGVDGSIQRLGGLRGRIFPSLADLSLQPGLGLAEFLRLEGRQAQLLGHQLDQRRQILGQALPAYADVASLGPERQLRAQAVQQRGDGHLVAAGAAFLQQHAGQQGHGGIGRLAGRVGIAQRHHAGHGHHLLRRHGIDQQVDAAGPGAHDAIGDARLSRDRQPQRGEQHQPRPQVVETNAHHVDFSGTNQPVVLWSSLRYLRATRCTSAGVTFSSCSSSVTNRVQSPCATASPSKAEVMLTPSRL